MMSRESPTHFGPDVLKVPSWATPAGVFGNYTQRQQRYFVFFYLEVPSIVVVEGLEELVWVWDVCDELQSFLPEPETDLEVLQKTKQNKKQTETETGNICSSKAWRHFCDDFIFTSNYNNNSIIIIRCEYERLC